MSLMVWPFLTRTFAGRGPGIGAGDAAFAESGRAAAMGAGVPGVGTFVAGAGLDFGVAVESRFAVAGGALAAWGATGGRGGPEAGGASAADARSFALASPVPRAAFARWV